MFKFCNKFFLFVVLALFFSSTLNAAVPQRRLKSFDAKRSKNERVIQSQIGLKIPEWGIAIDAIYNPSLSNIIPGYNIINIVLTNYRGEMINLDVKRDKWIIVDSKGKKHTLYNHVRDFNKKLWVKLPKKLQGLLDYPHAISPGKASTIDVFLPKSIDLFNFKEVIWKSSHFNKEFSMMTNYEKSLAMPNNSNEFDAPKNSPVVNLESETNNPPPEQQVIPPLKYQVPKIGKVSESDNKSKVKQPAFNTSFDDTIIIRN